MTRVRVTETVKITREYDDENIDAFQWRGAWDKTSPETRLVQTVEVLSDCGTDLLSEGKIEHTYDVQELNEDGSLKDDADAIIAQHEENRPVDGEYESGTNHPLHDER